MKTINLNLNTRFFTVMLLATITFSFTYSDNAIAQSSADKTGIQKGKITVVVEDEKGNKKEYKSLDEMPADLRAEFLKGRKPFFFSVDTSYFKSLKELAGKSKFDADNLMLKKFFNSDTTFFKKFNGVLSDSSLFALKKPDGVEWKKQLEELNGKFNSPEFKLQREKMWTQTEELRKRLDSPEFKAKQDEIVKQYQNRAPFFQDMGSTKKQDEMNNKIDELNKKLDELLKQLSVKPAK